MELFIEKLEAKSIEQMEAYLIAAGLKDYDLSSIEQQALDQFSEISFQSFELKDLFDILPTKKKFNAGDIEFGGRYRYIARGEGDNGIRGYITEDVQYLNDKNTLSFGQDTATLFYQDEAYFTGDKIKVLRPKDHVKLNRNTAQMFVAAIRRSFSGFSWGSSSYKVSVIDSTKIQLPVSNGEIDFYFIDSFISAIKKIAIKDLVLYTDQKVFAYKEVI